MWKEEDIEELNKEIANCEKCDLRESCIQPVPGGGNLDADIFFLGEAGGRDEDEQARVFCGRAGRLLNAWIIKELSLERKNVFVANICKCRPPNNRDPKPAEIEACMPYIEQQIEIVSPKVIVTLGRVAVRALLDDTWFKITQQHGKWRKYGEILVMPIYHPSFLLRQMSEKNKNAVKIDLKKVAEKVEK